jgi:hypothetical protein
MVSYSESPTRLQSPISEDANYDSIYRQASNAFERFLAQQEENQSGLPLSVEPTDHEAEGAMLYVMSRGR